MSRYLRYGTPQPVQVTGGGTRIIRPAASPAALSQAAALSFSATVTAAGVVGTVGTRMTFPPIPTVDTLVSDVPTMTQAAQATTTIAGGTLVAPTDSRIHYRGAGGFGFGTGFPLTTVYGPTSRYDYTWPSPEGWSVTFRHTGTTFEVMTYLVSTSGSWRMKVNGQRVTDLAVPVSGLTAGGRYVRKFVFGSSATRVITLEFGYHRFGGVFVNTASDTIAAPPAFNYRAIFQGDSITGGSNMSTGLINGTFPQRIADYIGVDDPWNVAIGSTGYVTAGTSVTIPTRSSDVTSWSPDIVVVFAGYNDAGATAGTIQTAATSTFGTYIAALPAAEIYVVGPWAPMSPATTNLNTADTEVKAAAAASSLPYISPITGNVYDKTGTLIMNIGAWIANSTDVATYIGADNVHPNDAGDVRIALMMRTGLYLASDGNAQVLASPVAVTATVTAAGATGLSGSATVASTATITAAGVVGKSTGAAASISATVVASGVVGVSSGVTVAAAAAISAIGAGPSGVAPLGYITLGDAANSTTHTTTALPTGLQVGDAVFVGMVGGANTWDHRVQSLGGDITWTQVMVENSASGHLSSIWRGDVTNTSASGTTLDLDALSATVAQSTKLSAAGVVVRGLAAIDRFDGNVSTLGNVSTVTPVLAATAGTSDILLSFAMYSRTATNNTTFTYDGGPVSAMAFSADGASGVHGVGLKVDPALITAGATPGGHTFTADVGGAPRSSYSIAVALPASGAVVPITAAITAGGSVAASSSASASTTVTTTATGSVAASSAAIVSTSATVAASGAANLASAATVAATATVTSAGGAGRSAVVTVPVTASVSTSGATGLSSGASVATMATTSAAASAALSGTVAVGTTATISAGGVVGLSSAATVPITVAAASTGSAALTGTAALAVSATATAAGVVGKVGAASVATAVSVAAAGVVGLSGDVSVGIAAGVLDAGSANLSKTASLAITATVSATGSTVLNQTSTVPISVTTTAAGNVATSSGAIVGITATVTGVGAASRAGAATLAVTATFTATGVITSGLSGTAAVATTATVTAAGNVATSSGVVIATTASITPGPTVGRSTGASVPVTATTVAAGSASRASAATVATTVLVASAGTALRSGSASLAIAATVVAAGIVGVSSAASLPVSVGITAAGSAAAGAMTFRAYDTATPDDVANTDSAVNVGMEFYVTSAATCTQIGFWQGSSGSPDFSDRTAQLYSTSDGITGTELARVTLPVSGSGWQMATLSTPVNLTPNQRYRAVILHPAGGYAFTPHYYDAGPGATDVTVGGTLVIPSAANALGGKQGSFHYSGTAAFPDGAFNSANYWVDVQVAVGVTPSVTLPIGVTTTVGGQVGVSRGATTAVTATVTAVGVVGSGSAASVPVTAAVTAVGLVGSSRGSTVATSAAIAASGVVTTGLSSPATVPATVTVTAAGQLATSSTTLLAVAANVVASGDVQITTPPTTKGITFTLVATGVVGTSSDAAVVISAGVDLTGKLTGGTVTVPIAVTVIASGAVATASGAVVVISVGLTLDGVIRGLSFYRGPKITVGSPEDSPLDVRPARRSLVGVGRGAAGHFGAGSPTTAGPTIGGPRGTRTVGAPNDSNRG